MLVVVCERVVKNYKFSEVDLHITLSNTTTVNSVKVSIRAYSNQLTKQHSNVLLIFNNLVEDLGVDLFYPVGAVHGVKAREEFEYLI